MEGESGASPKGAAALPDDVVAEVVSLLEAHDRARVAATCKAWRHVERELPLRGPLVLTVAADVRSADEGGGADLLRSARHRLHLSISCARLLAVDEAAAALAAERFRGLQALRLRLCFAMEPADVDAHHLRQLGEPGALPPALRRLELEPAGPPFPGLKRLWSAVLSRLPLASCAPALREVALVDEPRAPASFPWQAAPHPSLEYVGARLKLFKVDEVRELLSPACLPSLRRARELQIGSAVIDPEDADHQAQVMLLELAARGVTCGSLSLVGVDLTSRGAAEAAAALLRPDADAVPQLECLFCTLPHEWPPGAFAGVEVLKLHDAYRASPPLLRWIVGGAHAPTLRRLHLRVVLDGPPEEAEALAGALEELGPGAGAEVAIARAEPAVARRLLAAALGSPRIRRACAVRCDAELLLASSEIRKAYEAYREARELALADPDADPGAGGAGGGA
eukprot:tig00001224_g7645.t1